MRTPAWADHNNIMSMYFNLLKMVYFILSGVRFGSVFFKGRCRFAIVAGFNVQNGVLYILEASRSVVLCAAIGLLVIIVSRIV